jgi:hypothetical protein
MSEENKNADVSYVTWYETKELNIADPEVDTKVSERI